VSFPGELVVAQLRVAATFVIKKLTCAKVDSTVLLTECVIVISSLFVMTWVWVRCVGTLLTLKRTLDIICELVVNCFLVVISSSVNNHLLSFSYYTCILQSELTFLPETVYLHPHPVTIFTQECHFLLD